MYNIKEILEQVNDFPTLPTIYSALLEKISDPNSTIEDIAKIISSDPAASAKILRTVNSSVFSLRKKIESIPEAIFHVGFNEVKNLVTALSVMDIFSDIESLNDLHIVELWKHSIAVGVITRLIGKQLNVKNIENYYISGMLHDLGKFFFIKSFPKEYNKVIRLVHEKDIEIEVAEVEIFGCNHSEIGNKLAEKWNLPQSISVPIKYHQSGISENEFIVETACIHLANITAIILQLGDSGSISVPKPNPLVWQSLNLPSKTFTILLPQIITDYEQSFSILFIGN